MLGYLNAPSPFTEDGWFITGDIVEVVGDSLRILGRDSDVINIGGEKVFPAEVENILLQIPGIEDVIVCGEKNFILGNIVVANIKTKPGINPTLVKKMARKLCLKKMSSFKVPQKIQIVSEISCGDRYKKMRNTIIN
jgi:acyl-coenzyme A synthetase/AMP-(fatty) acid ligase